MFWRVWGVLIFAVFFCCYCCLFVFSKSYTSPQGNHCQNTEITNPDLWTFKMKELNLDIQNLKLSSKKNTLKIIQIFFVFLCTMNKNFKHLYFNLTSDKFGSF